jgi:hypothetical protein
VAIRPFSAGSLSIWVPEGRKPEVLANVDYSFTAFEMGS